jgi:hypothetical protein
MKILYIFLGISGIYLIINFITNKLLHESKLDVIDDLKNIFKAKKNISGYWEFYMDNKKILLEYDTEKVPGKVVEYIIAMIEINQQEKHILKKCPVLLDFTIINYKPYIVIYSDWGYRGEKFKLRLKNKLTEIEK